MAGLFRDKLGHCLKSEQGADLVETRANDEKSYATTYQISFSAGFPSERDSRGGGDDTNSPLRLSVPAEWTVMRPRLGDVT